MLVSLSKYVGFAFKDPEKWRRMQSLVDFKRTGFILSVTKKTVILLCAGYAFQKHVANFWLLSDFSMEPTFSDGQVVVSTTLLGEMTRGDVVIVKHPIKPKENICKRVIALPGDKVHYNNRSTNVPSGQMWLEGDDKARSWDSRDYGPVPIGLLQGIVICRLKPFSTRKHWMLETKSSTKSKTKSQ